MHQHRPALSRNEGRIYSAAVPFLFWLEELFHQSYKRLFFLPPCVGPVDSLAPFRDGQSLPWVRSDKFDLFCQFICISRLEEEKGIFIEIILNARRTWSNHGLATCQVLENASGHIDLCEFVAPVRDHANVTAVDRGHNLLQRPLPEMKHILLEATFLRRSHDSFQERSRDRKS